MKRTVLDSYQLRHRCRDKVHAILCRRRTMQIQCRQERHQTLLTLDSQTCTTKVYSECLQLITCIQVQYLNHGINEMQLSYSYVISNKHNYNTDNIASITFDDLCSVIVNMTMYVPEKCQQHQNHCYQMCFSTSKCTRTRFRLGLCLRPRWVSLQCSPDPIVS